MGTFSPNKNLSLLSAGDNAGTWGVGASTALNEGVFSLLDLMLGGIVSKSVAGSNITLTSDESQNVIIRLEGAQSANITLTNPCIGFYIVENLTTGNFTITVTNGISGEIAQKGQSVFIADPTNGARVAVTDSFPPGTRTAFNQSSAPTGWTKDTSINDAAIRLSSTGGGNGGSTAFTSIFSARTIARTNLPNFTLPVSDPGHRHNFAGLTAGSNNVQGGQGFHVDTLTTTTTTTGISVNSGGSGTPMDFAVRYFDFCVCTKN